jgi:hypothetical protein
MSKKEQRVWQYVLANRKATVREIAEACGVETDFVGELLAKIGTPEEIWRDGPVAEPQSTRDSILDAAKAHISGDRHATHGAAENSFSTIAGHWTWWLSDKLQAGECVTAYDVAQMMVGFKQSRMKYNREHLDSAQDLCGYGALAGEIGFVHAERKVEKP